MYFQELTENRVISHYLSTRSGVEWIRSIESINQWYKECGCKVREYFGDVHKLVDGFSMFQI